MLYPAFLFTARALSISVITPIAKFKPMHWCSKNPSPIFSCPLIATMRAFKTDWFFHILLLCYYVNDRAPLAYPAFRFRSVLVRSAFPQMSGLMLCAYPTFLSADAASDKLGFYGLKGGTWTHDIWTHKPAFYLWTTNNIWYFLRGSNPQLPTCKDGTLTSCVKEVYGGKRG